MTRDKSNSFPLLLSQSFQLIALFLCGVFFYWKINTDSIRRLLNNLQWRKNEFIRGSLLGIGLISFLVAVNIVYEVEFLKFANFDITNLAVCLCLFLLVSIIEETFVCGYVLRNLADSLHPVMAIFISSGVFAALHLANPNITAIGFLNLFLSGFLLGAIYYSTGNLWYVIGCHFTWNFFQGPIFGYEISGMKVMAIFEPPHSISSVHWINGGEFGLEGSMSMSVLLIFVCVYYFWNSRETIFTHSAFKK